MCNTKKWFIVESPSKAKTINKIIKNIYKNNIIITVISTYGHIQKIAKVKVNNDEYILEWEKLENYNKLKKKLNTIKQNDIIYLLTDPDREGELIANHVLLLIKETFVQIKNIKIFRISTNEITIDGISNAINNIKNININLFKSAQTRASLDNIIGYELSSLLWTKIPGCKSLGRVQSVVLNEIDDRETTIIKFIKKTTYKVSVKIQNLEFKFNKEFLSNEEAMDFVSSCKKHLPLFTSSIQKKSLKKILPFNTQKIQRFAFNYLGLSIAKTLFILQKLYEGTCDNNGEGFITYHRTDSFYLSNEFIATARNFIKNKFNNDFIISEQEYNKIQSKYKKDTFSQESHEAIRPSNLYNICGEKWEKKERDIYNTLFEYSLSSLMNPPIIEEIKNNISFNVNNQIINFTTITYNILFEGYFIINKHEKKQFDYNQIHNKEIFQTIQDNIKNNLITLNFEIKEHQSIPPARFNEASIIKFMVSNGIGRPSTYGYIINILKNREYTIFKNNTFYPTGKGRILSLFAKEYLSAFINKEFTSIMEEELNMICLGTIEDVSIIIKFYKKLKETIQTISKISRKDILCHIEKIILQDNNICNECNGQFLLRFNTKTKQGFILCNQYPKCKNIKSLYLQ